MVGLARPPDAELVRPDGVAPLGPMDQVYTTLRSFDRPVRRDEILQALSASAHPMSPQVLNTALQFLLVSGGIEEDRSGRVRTSKVRPS